MRILADLRSHLSNAPELIQVQPEPVEGAVGAIIINGKYAIPTPLGLDFPVTEADYVLDGAGNIDGGDVVSKGYAHLLLNNPQYQNVYFNPLLTSDHVAELVLDQSFAFIDRSTDPPNSFYARFQTGREEGVPDDGQMPTHTAVLPLNTTTNPARPGFIITEEIDIGAYTLDCDSNPVGADEFMVYWKLYDFSVSDDYAGAIAGPLNGLNEPAIRSVSECEQEPTGFSVYLSPDDGDHWCQVGLLEPIAFCEKTTSIRLAFVNTSTSKVYIATYGVLF